MTKTVVTYVHKGRFTALLRDHIERPTRDRERVTYCGQRIDDEWHVLERPRLVCGRCEAIEYQENFA